MGPRRYEHNFLVQSKPCLDRRYGALDVRSGHLSRFNVSDVKPPRAIRAVLLLGPQHGNHSGRRGQFGTSKFRRADIRYHALACKFDNISLDFSRVVRYCDAWRQQGDSNSRAAGQNLSIHLLQGLYSRSSNAHSRSLFGSSGKRGRGTAKATQNVIPWASCRTGSINLA